MENTQSKARRHYCSNHFPAKKWPIFRNRKKLWNQTRFALKNGTFVRNLALLWLISFVEWIFSGEKKSKETPVRGMCLFPLIKTLKKYSIQNLKPNWNEKNLENLVSQCRGQLFRTSMEEAKAVNLVITLANAETPFLSQSMNEKKIILYSQYFSWQIISFFSYRSTISKHLHSLHLQKLN